MLNEEKFSKVNIKYVIVVQVHNRLEYLQLLINSLNNVKDIESCLIIFSHDIYSADIDKPIKNISFARVMQIYYPYNLQLFPTIFPGLGDDDCPPSISKDEAYRVNCSSRSQFDSYDHYRNPKLSQIKHHWWWKLNYTFEKVLKRFKITGKIILIEEDHYVMPDAIHVLNSIYRDKDKLCNDCNIVVLGSYKWDDNKYVNDLNKVNIMQWYSSMHNMGMVIDSDLWEEITKCSQSFCTYDDYNWDWTLLKISLTCMSRPMKALTITSPRILHIGDCGTHVHDCESQKSLKRTTKLLDLSKDQLFPETLMTKELIKKTPRASQPNGGWKDIRDQYLCYHNSLNMPKGDNMGYFSEKYINYKEERGLYPFMDLDFLIGLP
uniref:Alpha-1,6-mannosyl-glycoprotein 2-beta-N-acetylglucosaminyltransferase n=1 Tax=Parastrongyloides trichosuri TaxID=131310 RepID=A0A0N4ZCM6_PARTI